MSWQLPSRARVNVVDSTSRSLVKKSIVFCVLILVIPTLAMGALLGTGIESESLEAYATPFLYPGCFLAWMIGGDNFASSQEFLWFGFQLSIPINTVLGVLLGVMIKLIGTRFWRLRAMSGGGSLDSLSGTATPPGPE